MGPLAGVRIIELAALGPAPFCGMLLADLGAEVILIERPGEGDGLSAGILRRGKRSVTLDLKNAEDIALLKRMAADADALIEGMRPGVLERLGLGPQVLHALNPRLVIGRMTGWGQSGPLAHTAGHDNNYIARSGALWYAGAEDQPPQAPPTLVGDLGGGAMYLAVGLLAALHHARASGQGQVVDAAIVDGSAHLMNLLLDMNAAGSGQEARGQSLLDGPHWYASYRCADGRDLTVGALEAKFYRELLTRLGLADDPDFASQHARAHWPAQKAKLAQLFASQPRAHWQALLDGSDACAAPIHSPSEAARDPHLAARAAYFERDGHLEGAPAPRFSATPGAAGPIPQPGQDSAHYRHKYA
ncbi:CaiB/BaiF CoA-transferase family protein [Massilia sp. TS11]|uniref:CaiB/BaiF CoA transferase family protein n=1 Tax=Massilia sp. TS11 TaxID=2908003 RepID=UPI001EDB46AC|nr:CaiB/BaiF CoA-transferase family protein [Massilia sp. TS11]MCG2583791.1 CoA transferase [Massilia sp. TS11]